MFNPVDLKELETIAKRYDDREFLANLNRAIARAKLLNHIDASSGAVKAAWRGRCEPLKAEEITVEF